MGRIRRWLAENIGGVCMAVVFAASIAIAARIPVGGNPENAGDEGAAQAATSPLLGVVVVVDPGHGGYDCGAVGRYTGVLEKDLNLKVSLLLRDILIQGGASVVMTRETDIALCPEATPVGRRKKEDMAARANIIDEADADVVLSVHMNEFTNSRYYGAQVFYTQDDPPPSAMALAKCVQDAMRQSLDPDNTRKEKSGDYYILRVRPVSVLVECGFLSNKQEEALLCDADYQQKVAWAIYAGLVDYLAIDRGSAAP